MRAARTGEGESSLNLRWSTFHLRRVLEGVDEINNVAVACCLNVEGACHGDERSTRRPGAVKQRRR